MKKIFLSICIILICVNVFAAGTVTVTSYQIGRVKTILFEWTADASDGSVPVTALTTAQAESIKGWHCYLAETDPGSTAPTADYDITIDNEFDIDIFGGNLTDRSATVSEQTTPIINTALGGRTVIDVLTFTLTGNSVNSATGKLRLYFSQ